MFNFDILAVNCGVLSAPTNGYLIGSGTTYRHLVAFDCDPGFRLSGAHYTICQENGEWTNTSVSCQGT